MDQDSALEERTAISELVQDEWEDEDTVEAWPPPTPFIRGSEFLETLEDNDRPKFFNEAYLDWRATSGFLRLEWPLEKFDDPGLLQAQRVVKLTGGWLRYLRTLRRLSTNHMAAFLGISKSTYAGYEESERNGAISIRTLEKIAKKFKMELVVGLRPIELPSKTIWNGIEAEALKRFEKRSFKEGCAPRSLSGAALILCTFARAQTRKRQNWTERANQLDLGFPP